MKAPTKFTFDVVDAALTIHNDPDWGELIMLPMATGCESSLITLCKHNEFDINVVNERYEQTWFKYARKNNLLVE